MKRKTQNKRSKGGMTIVEVVIFLSLTLSLLGGIIPVAMQAGRVDRAVEEKTAAFFVCKSTLEELHPVKFEDLVSSKTGVWTQQSNGWVRVRNNINFYTRGGPSQTKLFAQEKLRMVYGATGATTNCTATVSLTWVSARGNKQVTLKESVSTIFYP